MKKQLLFFVLIFFYGLTSTAQQTDAQVEFMTTEHDFGEVDELGGPLTFDFTFFNKSDQPYQLTSVRASCGCTTPFWDKEAIQPGDTGLIKVVFNPLNRPGTFNKTVTIKSDGVPQVKLLRIKGKVKPKPKLLEDEFPTAIGGIRFKSKFINFGTISTEKPVTEKIALFNASSDSISFLSRVVTGNHIAAIVKPAVMPPKTEAIMEVTYFPGKRDELGFVNDNMTLFTDELEESNKTFSVLATILEYFPPMTEEELAKAPHLSLEDKEHDFGNVKEGEKLTHTFVFENTGKEKLNIRKTRANCGCTVSELKKDDYKGGQTGELKVTFNTSGRRGPQIKRVTIFSNDPTAPAQDIVVKAFVESEE